MDTSELAFEKLMPFVDALPFQDKKRFWAYRQQADKKLFLCSRMILRKELNKKGVPFGVDLRMNRWGKPCIPGEANLFFNISHSYPMVLVAFASQEIGADIEQVVSWGKDDLLKHATLVFHKEEIKWLAETTNVSEARRLFTAIWAAKESCIKLAGKGFEIDTTQFRVFDKSATKARVENKTCCTELFSVFAAETEYRYALSLFGNNC